MARYLIAAVIATSLAVGGLFSLGTLKYLDRAFKNDKSLRKSTLHYSWIGSTLAPPVIMALYLLLGFVCEPMTAAITILTFIFVVEIAVTVFAIKVSRKFL
jgi:hypothetical protein